MLLTARLVLLFPIYTVAKRQQKPHVHKQSYYNGQWTTTYNRCNKLLK